MSLTNIKFCLFWFIWLCIGVVDVYTDTAIDAGWAIIYMSLSGLVRETLFNDSDPLIFDWSRVWK